MNHFDKRLSEALDDIPEVPDEEPVWDLDAHIDALQDRDPLLEEYLLSADDASQAITYAKKFFGRAGWPELEEKIKDNSAFALEYAQRVIRGRFPEGEDAIARDPFKSYEYASDVIRDEFPKGERAIARHPWYSLWYAMGVLKRRFPLGERVIADDPSTAYMYARYVIKGRFPKGEEAIYSGGYRARQYARRYEQFLKEIGEL